MNSTGQQSGFSGVLHLLGLGQVSHPSPVQVVVSRLVNSTFMLSEEHLTMKYRNTTCNAHCVLLFPQVQAQEKPC